MPLYTVQRTAPLHTPHLRLVRVVVQHPARQKRDRLRLARRRLLLRQRRQRRHQRRLQLLRDVLLGGAGVGDGLDLHVGEEELDLARGAGGGVGAVGGVAGAVCAVQRAHAALHAHTYV